MFQIFFVGMDATYFVVVMAPLEKQFKISPSHNFGIKTDDGELFLKLHYMSEFKSLIINTSENCDHPYQVSLFSMVG